MSHALHQWTVAPMDDRYLVCTLPIKRGHRLVPCPARSLNPDKMKAPAQQHSPTSLKAADEVQKHMGRVLREVLIQFSVVGDRGLTDDELISVMGRPNTVRPRRVDLHRLRYIADSHTTRPTISGKAAVVWQITEEGKAWLRTTTTR